ncbi:MAG: RICIN domain-containing protein [Bacteroidales bacterium]|nr:RICIN domain-containing protein [Bacteroidales bacterium]
MKHNSFIFFLLTTMSCLTIMPANAQLQKSEKQLEAMLLLNQRSTENPTYTVPCATANFNLFATAAFTVGEAIDTPLGYFATAAPSTGYCNYSRTAFIAGKGQYMHLAIMTNKNTSIASAYIYLFADWDRDGIFETDLGKHALTTVATSETPGVKIPISIPSTAVNGKTRIRAFLTTGNVTAIHPNGSLSSGYIHDFVVFVSEPVSTPGKVLITTASNNPSWGTTVIESNTLPENGRYPTGTAVTFKALRQGAVEFIGWSDGTELVSTSAEYTTTANATLFLVGIFKTATASLEAPQTSTANEPIWYQIKNAQTDTRLNRFLAYSATIPAGYTTALRIEKPEDFSDPFLWRLEPSATGMVKLVNKGTAMQVAADGTLNTALNVQTNGSDFKIDPSGHANGSYSIKYNNNATQLLNGGLSFNVVLYNAGVGTGSGWYFYRVPDLSTSVRPASYDKPLVSFVGDELHCARLTPGSSIALYSVSGHALLQFTASHTSHIQPFTPKGAFIAVVKTSGNTYFTYKLMK